MRKKLEYGQGLGKAKTVQKLKIAFLGSGQVHGEDDAISLRPYQSSLLCTENHSEVFVMLRNEFYRTFKVTAETWKFVVEHAKAKEQYCIQRCRQYLETTKLIISPRNFNVDKIEQ